MSVLGHIYIITNALNGKTYVGKTTQLPADRWWQHRQASRKIKGSPHLYAAMQKYGHAAFSFSVLCSTPSEELDEAERFVIMMLGTRIFGYNLREGGDSGRHSIITRKKMSDQRRGRPSHRRGKHLSAEHIAAARAAQNTPEFHERASAAAKARGSHTQSEATRAKIAHANSIRMWTAASRAKASASKKGKIPANIDMLRTPEVRAKLRAAWVIRRQRGLSV